MSDNRIEMDNGVTILTLAAGEFGGEYDRRSLFYIISLWFMSLWAMAGNLVQALLVKMFSKQKVPLRQILWNMGRDPNHFSCFFGDRFSRYNHAAKVHAASWHALDLFYNYHQAVKPQLGRNIEGWLTRHWMEKLQNRQAVANRLKIVIRILSEAFDEFVKEPEIRLLSIASGSAQAIVEAIKKCKQINVRVVLLDSDPSAIDQAKKIVNDAKIDPNFNFVCDKTTVLEAVCADFRPHIIEMVGFLDYRPKKQAIKLIKRVMDCLSEQGVFITCNINKNLEKPLLDWVLLWPMFYRNQNEFSELLVNGGFSPGKIHLIYEPFRIHGIAICRK
jgi:ubiquinone/menaquinone biosynthesis C-methylase UbiE